MAGKMRIVAKLFLGTTVLASTGSGAYYYTTHGFTLPSLLQTKKPATSSDLDAVASAWADRRRCIPTDSSLSSPIARSAQPEATASEKKSDESSDDRYAIESTPKAVEVKTAEPEPDKVDASASDEKSEAESPIVAHVETPAAGQCKEQRSSRAHARRCRIVAKISVDTKNQAQRRTEGR